MSILTSGLGYTIGCFLSYSVHPSSITMGFTQELTKQNMNRSTAKTYLFALDLFLNLAQIAIYFSLPLLNLPFLATRILQAAIPLVLLSNAAVTNEEWTRRDSKLCDVRLGALFIAGIAIGIPAALYYGVPLITTIGLTCLAAHAYDLRYYRIAPES